ncbi:MAG TPA: hypothetical protein VHD36_06835 [Pirellulales bacterium]|nr:hypothetical protein [Pirellulales bacterium]
MCEVIDICSRDVPHADWSRFSELDYNGDVAALRSWIPRVFKNRPAPFSIQGLWIGLCNPCKGDMVWADMYVGAVSQYVPEDPELGWLWTGQRHYPKEAFADSSSLRAIYEIAYGTDFGLGNDAEWPLCLAFGALAARSLLRDQTTRLVDPTAPQIGVVVGFDSGDMLKLGELTSTGFVDPAFN